MTELTLQDIHNVSLEIAKDIHDFCVKNGIKYSLDGGSLLGAVRHNGFIPWDDDIDIIMPRPDYDLFFKTYKSSKGYKPFCYELGNSIVPFGRVCEMYRTSVIPSTPWTKEKTGVFIDIFPADGVYDNLDDTIHFVKYLKRKGFWVLQNRSLIASYSTRPSIFGKFKLMIKKIIASLYIGNPLEKYVELIKSNNYSLANYWGDLAFLGVGDEKMRMQPQSRWETLVLHKFEDTEFFIFKEYDAYLSMLYGDYMKLPPLSKRRTSGSSISSSWR